MADCIGEAGAVLASVLQSNASVAAAYWRGSDYVELNVTPGRRIEFPYDGAEIPPSGKRFFVPVADLMLSEAPLIPRDGDRIELVDDDGNALQTFEAVRFGAEPPARLDSTGHHWIVNGLDVTNRPRRDTTVDILTRNTAATRNEFGEQPRSAGDAWLTLATAVKATIEPMEGSEVTIGGKLSALARFRVTLPASAITTAARLLVKNGWLTGKYLEVEAASRESAAAIEMTLVCRMAG